MSSLSKTRTRARICFSCLRTGSCFSDTSTPLRVLKNQSFKSCLIKLVTRLENRTLRCREVQPAGRMFKLFTQISRAILQQPQASKFLWKRQRYLFILQSSCILSRDLLSSYCPQVLGKLNISFVHKIQHFYFLAAVLQRDITSTRNCRLRAWRRPRAVGDLFAPVEVETLCDSVTPQVPIRIAESQNISFMHALLTCRGRGIPLERAGELQRKANGPQI